MCAQVCYPSGRQQPAIVILLTPVSSLYWSLKILGGSIMLLLAGERLLQAVQ